MQIGCCIKIENYQEANNIGFDFVELSGIEVSSLNEDEWSSFKKLYNHIKLPILGFNAFCDDRVAMVGKNVDNKKSEEYIRKLCLRGNEIHVNNLGIGAPLARKLENNFSLNTAYKQMDDFIDILLVNAKKYKQKILVEALHDQCNDFLTTTKEVYEYISKKNNPNLGLVLDFYHMIKMNEKPNDVSSYMDFVKHTHVSHWASDLSRAYIDQNDLPYLLEIKELFSTVHYDQTISIESTTNNYLQDAKLSFNILTKVFK